MDRRSHFENHIKRATSIAAQSVVELDFTLRNQLDELFFKLDNDILALFFPSDEVVVEPKQESPKPKKVKKVKKD